VVLDCDVLQADGGTRTAAVSGAYVALHDACSRLLASRAITTSPLRESLAAVSVGILGASALLDLDYLEDSNAEVDLNVVMTGSGRFVEVQGTAEGTPFGREELDSLLDLAASGIARIGAAQRRALETPPPARPG